MDKVKEFRELILPELQKHFPGTLINENKSDETEGRIILRSCFVKEDGIRFKNIFSQLTNTDWIVSWQVTRPKKLIFRKMWFCQQSRLNKTVNSKRNSDCPAKLNILIKKVNRDTKKNDPFLKMDPPRSAEILILLNHSHTTDSPEDLRLLRVDDAIKELYFEYFSNGMTVAQAMHFHQSQLLGFQNLKMLASASFNPTRRQVSYLYEIWNQENPVKRRVRQHRDRSYKKNTGSLAISFKRLKDNIEYYKSKGMTVKIKEGVSWAVLLVTDIMKRVQLLEYSKDVIFVDSTCSPETSSPTVTVLLSATKVGAIPLAVLIHSAQTKENYVEAFQLLKDSFSLCFGGSDNPEIFFTNDSTTEKSALKLVWPNSKQMLYHFEAAQQQWQWLFSESSKVPAEERPRLMKLFQAVLCAATGGELESAYNTLVKENAKYPEFVSQFLSFYKRRAEWVSFFRKDLITGNDSNSYSEATVRILKDVVFSQIKACNVETLPEFFMDELEKYLMQKLLGFVYSEESVNSVMYCSLSSTSNFEDCDILELKKNIFSVKGKTSEESYTINFEIGVCTCPSSMFVGFCKHLHFFMKHRKITLPNAPSLTHTDKYSLAMLALGNECPPFSFFLEDLQLACEEKESVMDCDNLLKLGMNQSEPYSNSTNEEINQLKPNSNSTNEEISQSEINFNSTDDEPLRDETDISSTNYSIKPEDIVNEFKRISSLVEKETSIDNAERLLRNLKRIKSVTDLNNLYVLHSLKQTQKKRKNKSSTGSNFEKKLCIKM